MFSWFKSDSGTAADIYIDLGTANTIISARGHGIILNEPSLVAYSENSPGKKKILGVGFAAQEVLSKTPGHIIAQKPIRDGVIADFDTAQEMLRNFLSRPEVKKTYSRPRVVVGNEYTSFYKAVDGSKLSPIQKTDILKRFLDQEKAENNRRRWIKVATHALIAASNFYSASRDDDKNIKGVLNFLGAMNVAIAVTYSF